MVDDDIVNYVKDNLSRGVSVEEVKTSLRAKGWPEDQINLAIQEAGASQQPQKPVPALQPAGGNVPPQQAQKPQEEPKKGGKGKLIVAVFIMIILFFFLVYVGYNILQSTYNMFPEAGGILPFELPFSG